MRNCVKLNGFVRNVDPRKERNILTDKRTWTYHVSTSWLALDIIWLVVVKIHSTTKYICDLWGNGEVAVKNSIKKWKVKN